MQSQNIVQGNCGKVVVEIQHLAMGALSTVQGDTTLSYTDGVSSAASDICALVADNAASDYASVYIIGSNATKGMTLLHVQGNHVVMGNGTRAYATRVAYECSEACIEDAGGYAPIIDVLDRMRLYNKQEWGVDANYTLTPKQQKDMTPEEATLFDAIRYCLENRCRLFVKLGDDEKMKADEVRHSRRLKTILNAIDRLQPDQRLEANLAFSTDAMAAATLLPAMRIVAHHDSISNWGQAAENAMIMDWTSPNITTIHTPNITTTPSSALSSTSGLSSPSSPSSPSSKKDGCGLAVAVVVALGALALTLIL